MRQRMQEVLAKMEYKPSKQGIEDLSSDARLNLIINTQISMANGFGRFKKNQTKGVLWMWPAQEFFRAEERNEPRDWPARWASSGGKFFPGSSDYDEGRMIALKNEKIWEEISAFGLPYPPFDYNSGMSIRDITREEAVKLGILKEADVVDPQDRSFEDDVESDILSLDPLIRKALIESLGKGYKIKKGVVTNSVKTVKEHIAIRRGKPVVIHKYYAHYNPAKAEKDEAYAKVTREQVKEGDVWAPVHFVGGVKMKANDGLGGIKVVTFGAKPILPNGKSIYDYDHIRNLKVRDLKAVKSAKSRMEKLKERGLKSWLSDPVTLAGKKVTRKDLFENPEDAKKAYELAIDAAKRSTYGYTSLAIDASRLHPHVNLNPDADVYSKIVGKTASGDYKVQITQNPRAVEESDIEEFKNVERLRKEMPKLKKNLEALVKTSWTKKPHEDWNLAAAMLCQIDTGLRAGENGLSKVRDENGNISVIKTYGLCGLKTSHIVLRDVKKDSKGNITEATPYLRFTGKKGKDYKVDVVDMTVQEDLLSRRGGQKGTESVYEISPSEYARFAKAMMPQGCRPHNIRHAKACEIAEEEIKKFKGKPKDKDELKKWKSKVADAVAEQLNDNRSTVLKNYIDPRLFEEWQK